VQQRVALSGGGEYPDVLPRRTLVLAMMQELLHASEYFVFLLLMNCCWTCSAHLWPNYTDLCYCW